MGCTPSIDVHVEADDVQDGDVVGCFCGGISQGCMGRLKNSPVPYILRAPVGKKKEIIKYSDIEKFKEIDDHALNVGLYIIFHSRLNTYHPKAYQSRVKNALLYVMCFKIYSH